MGFISWIWAVSQSVGVEREFSQHKEMENMCGMERERAQFEAVNKKMGIFLGMKWQPTGWRREQLMELTGCKKTGIYRFPVYIGRNLSGSLWDMKGV